LLGAQLPFGDGPTGEMGTWLADDGPEPVCTSCIELRWDLMASEDCGVHSPPADVPDSRLDDMGRKRSRVRSNISEPMTPIAWAYRSLLSRDSLTMKSANKRTRSASLSAAASLLANARKRSMAASPNCSADCETTVTLVGGSEAADAGACRISEGVPAPLVSIGAGRMDRMCCCGGGVGSAFGTPDGDPSVMGTALDGCGEKGGVDAAGNPDPGRGVETVDTPRQS
jgi:hypothetical protein